MDAGTAGAAASHQDSTTHRAPAFGDDQRHAFQGHKTDGSDGAEPLQAGSIHKSGMTPQIPQAEGTLWDGRPRGQHMYPHLQLDVVGCVATPRRHLHRHVGGRDAEGRHSHDGVDGQTGAPLDAIVIHHSCHMTNTSTTYQTTGNEQVEYTTNH